MRKFVSLLTLLVVGTSVFAQDLSTREAGVWLKGGLAQFSQEETVAGQTTTAEDNQVVTQLGGMFNVLNKSSLKFGLGTQLSVAKVDFKTLLNNATIDEKKGALNAQALDVFGRLTSDMGLYVHAGYQADLGPSDSEDINSDLSNAVKLGLGINKETNLLAINVGVGTALTLKTDKIANLFNKRQAVELNFGDVYLAQASAAIKLGKALQAGVKAQYVNQTEGEVTGTVTKTTLSLDDAFSSLNLVPFLTYKQPNSPFRFNLRGGLPTEYFERGMINFTDGEALTGLVGLLGVGFEF